uniref:Uncharacterized protein n=1 Tax=Chromera velia CCMP2878 TaxID=1169474 RepID=A0A0G4HPB9_9ALVE|eukprot:Cvel_29813.t1-p1 / transcript=Cvel_29813.t1 / gene=Cvel_29813 / organism=Chromera_velia_CCMP2878 / gene_product=hypothetical protein / transcript_product=hypothetical protein / location=Cvel_scaffold4150:7631-10191(-) / protein_length=675 / sequence_SO=supercontig / SO=protein_coding / is_pseudo=false
MGEFGIPSEEGSGDSGEDEDEEEMSSTGVPSHSLPSTMSIKQEEVDEKRCFAFAAAPVGGLRSSLAHRGGSGNGRKRRAPQQHGEGNAEGETGGQAHPLDPQRTRRCMTALQGALHATADVSAVNGQQQVDDQQAQILRLAHRHLPAFFQAVEQAQDGPEGEQRVVASLKKVLKTEEEDRPAKKMKNRKDMTTAEGESDDAEMQSDVSPMWAVQSGTATPELSHQNAPHYLSDSGATSSAASASSRGSEVDLSGVQADTAVSSSAFAKNDEFGFFSSGGNGSGSGGWEGPPEFGPALFACLGTLEREVSNISMGAHTQNPQMMQRSTSFTNAAENGLPRGISGSFAPPQFPFGGTHAVPFGGGGFGREISGGAMPVDFLGGSHTTPPSADLLHAHSGADTLGVVSRGTLNAFYDQMDGLLSGTGPVHTHAHAHSEGGHSEPPLPPADLLPGVGDLCMPSNAPPTLGRLHSHDMGAPIDVTRCSKPPPVALAFAPPMKEKKAEDSIDALASLFVTATTLKDTTTQPVSQQKEQEKAQSSLPLADRLVRSFLVRLVAASKGDASVFRDLLEDAILSVLPEEEEGGGEEESEVEVEGGTGERKETQAAPEKREEERERQSRQREEKEKARSLSLGRSPSMCATEEKQKEKEGFDGHLHRPSGSPIGGPPQDPRVRIQV